MVLRLHNLKKGAKALIPAAGGRDEHLARSDCGRTPGADIFAATALDKSQHEAGTIKARWGAHAFGASPALAGFHPAMSALPPAPSPAKGAPCYRAGHDESEGWAVWSVPGAGNRLHLKIRAEGDSRAVSRYFPLTFRTCRVSSTQSAPARATMATSTIRSRSIRR